ncbi:MAG: rod shape-determining protein RodA [Rhodobacteraceae bacterium]|nr:rod shape-determining protein RodA [Paracoccaceae bacterium]
MNTDAEFGASLHGFLQNLSRINWVLIALITALLSIGVLALYSVSGGSFTPWASQQLLRAGLGFLLLFAVALTPVRVWRELSPFIYLAACALVVAGFFFGTSAKGAQRWVDLGFVSLQPSEFLKLGVVVLLARYYSTLPRDKVSRPLWVAWPAALILAPAALVAAQPDLGTSLLIAASGAIMMFLGGVHLLYFIATALLLAGAASVAILSRGTSWQIFQDYQYSRLDTFLNPDQDPFGGGYHITQSKIAIGSGGLNGRGFLQGSQSQMNFLPEKHTDFVFTTLAEEFGLIWCLILLAFYFLIVVICAVIALRSLNRFCSLLVLGLGGTFFLYFSTNIAMVTGLIPVVGVPLPFISYGGSSLMVLMIAFGLIQSAQIYAQRR